MGSSPSSSSVTVRFEDGCGLLTLSFDGVVGRDDLLAAHAKTLEAVGDRPVTGVVLDARASTPAYSPADLIDSVEQTLDDISPRRCAFVASGSRSEALMLIETVSFPYAVRVQAFGDREAARAWVLAAI